MLWTTYGVDKVRHKCTPFTIMIKLHFGLLDYCDMFFGTSTINKSF